MRTFCWNGNKFYNYQYSVHVDVEGKVESDNFGKYQLESPVSLSTGDDSGVSTMPWKDQTPFSLDMTADEELWVVF